jgi:hypothetical protein
MEQFFFKVIRRILPRLGMRSASDIAARLYLDLLAHRDLHILKNLNIVIGVPRSGTTLIAKLLSSHGLSISEPFRQIFFYGNPIGSTEHIHRVFRNQSRLAPLEMLDKLNREHSPLFIKETFIAEGTWAWKNDHLLSKIYNSGNNKFYAIVRDPRAIWFSALTRKEDSDKEGMYHLLQNIEAFAAWMSVKDIPFIRYEDLVDFPETGITKLLDHFGCFSQSTNLDSGLVGGGDATAFTSQSIFSSSVAKFLKDMPQEEQDFILTRTPFYREVFGYHLVR